jgi:hypothetical protein
VSEHVIGRIKTYPAEVWKERIDPRVCSHSYGT